MPPRPPLTAAARIKALSPSSRKSYSSSCLICSSAALAGRRQDRTKTVPSVFQQRSRARQQSNHTAEINKDHDVRATNPAEDISKLKATLADLQKNFRGYVNLSRLQLALRALEQTPGKETIRIGILAVTGQERTSAKVRELARLLIADPLKDEEEWERTLTGEQNHGKPVLLRIGEHSNDLASPEINNRLINELSISSPTLNAYRLEILITEVESLPRPAVRMEEDIDNAILVPSVEVPVSSTGRYTPVRTPVHKAILVGDGILDAASLVGLPVQAGSEIITSAVDLPGFIQEDRDQLRFRVVDVALAKSALMSFRESLDNAMSYEHDWFKSGLPELLQWVKAGTLESPGVLIKSPVRDLILSLLADASRRIDYEESRQSSALLSSRVSSSVLESLDGDLKLWSEAAHTELRDQLDIAFEGRRWAKLGWWKLFWRVDDVSMIASDILNQRFLTDAEREVIYLSGKIVEAGVFKASTASQQTHGAYKSEEPSTGIVSSPPTLLYQYTVQKSRDETSTPITFKPWPLDIPVTRAYLSTETIPALQALAQKLVLQTLTTSSFASLFAGLIYVSSFSAGFYEAGAVAAFGIVWSMRRIQKKWEIARKFWEGEVREEGRKAIRAVEGNMKVVLAGPTISPMEGTEEVQQAREAVDQVREALERVNSHSDN